jgi:hypothetical protein
MANETNTPASSLLEPLGNFLNRVLHAGRFGIRFRRAHAAYALFERPLMITLPWQLPRFGPCQQFQGKLGAQNRSTPQTKEVLGLEIRLSQDASPCPDGLDPEPPPHSTKKRVIAEIEIQLHRPVGPLTTRVVNRSACDF